MPHCELKWEIPIEFIKENGCAKFTEIANNWKGPFGKL